MKKSQAILARLMANENIRIIQNSNYSKPHFALGECVLAMPNWEDMDENLEVALLAEEVGHALFTPQAEWAELMEDTHIPESLFEVLEDVRVNKLMLDKYPGLDVDYRLAYQHVLDADQWDIKDKDVNAMSFVDRINIKSKFRTLVDVKFTEDEATHLKALAAVDTWEDMVAVAENIWNTFYAEAEVTKLSRMADEYYGKDVLPSVGTGTNEYVADEAADHKEDVDKGSSDYASNAGSNSADTNLQSGEYSSVTYESFSAKLHDMVTDKKSVVIDVPSLNVAKSCIVPYSEVAAGRQSPFIEIPNEDMNEIKKNVGLMSNEFNMRQSAQQMARARESRKGSLDVNKLHRYKYDDNIFQQVTTLPNAKSHGMVMLVDMSDSMSGILTKIRYQAGILAMFCDRAKIPFIVYGFTNGGMTTREAESEVLSHVSMGNTRMVELASSNLSKMDLQNAISHLLAANKYHFGVYDQMGGTPLGESLCALTRLIPMHQRDWNVEKMSFVSLCDGGGFRMSADYSKVDHSIKLNMRWDQRHKAEFRMPCGEIVHLDHNYGSHDFEEFVSYIRSTGVSTLGYHVVTNSNDGSWPSHRGNLRAEMVAVASDYHGFDNHFVIYSKGLEGDGSFDDHDSKFKKVETQFRHYMKGKKTSRTIARKVGETIG